MMEFSLTQKIFVGVIFAKKKKKKKKKKKTENETLTFFIDVKKKVLSQTNIAFCEASLSTIFNVFFGNSSFGSRLRRGLKTGRRKKIFL